MKRIWRTLRNLGPPFFEPNQISSSFLFISYLMTVHRAGMNRLDLRAAWPRDSHARHADVIAFVEQSLCYRAHSYCVFDWLFKSFNCFLDKRALRLDHSCFSSETVRVVKPAAFQLSIVQCGLHDGGDQSAAGRSHGFDCPSTTSVWLSVFEIYVSTIAFASYNSCQQ